MRLTLLGTGNALVTECYNTCFVLSDGNRHFLVDGGGGNALLHQLKAADFNWMDMRHIFITHKHVDHLLGLIWMVRLITQFMAKGKYQGEAFIYGHDEVITLLKELAYKLFSAKNTQFIDKRLHFIEVRDGESLDIIGHKTTFFDIRSTKVKQFGFTLEISPEKKLTCCGDEPFSECEEKYARGSFWLLHEAFCLYSEREVFSPYEKHHSTVKEACELAERLQIPNLLLYHTEDKNLRERKRLYTEEGRRFYHGRLWIPDDLETLDLHTDAEIHPDGK